MYMPHHLHLPRQAQFFYQNLYRFGVLLLAITCDDQRRGHTQSTDDDPVRPQEALNAFLRMKPSQKNQLEFLVTIAGHNSLWDFYPVRNNHGVKTR